MAIIGKLGKIRLVGHNGRSWTYIIYFHSLFDGTIPWFSNQNANIGLFNNNEIDSKSGGIMK